MEEDFVDSSDSESETEEDAPIERSEASSHISCRKTVQSKQQQLPGVLGQLQESLLM